MRINKLCPRCGVFNQMELQYDSGWQVECLLCSRIIPLPKEEVPKGLNPRQFEIVAIPSATDVQTSFGIPFGYYRPNRNDREI